MSIPKRVIIEAGAEPSDLYLCIAALNRYLAEFPDRSVDRERTYNTRHGLRKLYLREREKCIHITYTRYKIPPRYRRDRMLYPDVRRYGWEEEE